MWPFRKCIPLKDSGIFEGFTDWHSHILPAVDDGVRSVEEALEILHGYEALGMKTVWLTPHIMEDMPNTPESLKRKFEELRTAYSGQIELHLAAEHMLDNLFDERLNGNDLLPIGQRGDHLLVETSYFNPPLDLEGTLCRIRSCGYYPLLAHPERYVYMSRKDYRRLHEAGVRFQLDLFALAGMYGKRATECAGWLLEQGFYDAAGTDIHRKAVCDRIRGFRLSRKICTALTTLCRDSDGL